MVKIHIADLGIYYVAQILFQALDTKVKIQYLQCMSIVNCPYHDCTLDCFLNERLETLKRFLVLLTRYHLINVKIILTTWLGLFSISYDSDKKIQDQITGV